MATAFPKRGAQPFPDLPAVAETIPGFDLTAWQGVVVRAGTPAEAIARLNRDIVREQDQIHVLKAEWTYLNRPERIEELSKRFLDLAAPKPNQMGTIAQLPMRSSDTPVDPTASKSPSPAPKAP